MVLLLSICKFACHLNKFYSTNEVHRFRIVIWPSTDKFFIFIHIFSDYALVTINRQKNVKNLSINRGWFMCDEFQEFHKKCWWKFVLREIISDAISKIKRVPHRKFWNVSVFFSSPLYLKRWMNNWMNERTMFHWCEILGIPSHAVLS